MNLNASDVTYQSYDMIYKLYIISDMIYILYMNIAFEKIQNFWPWKFKLKVWVKIDM